MSPLHSFLVVASVLFSSAYAYVDFGSLTLPVHPQYEPTPRPNQLPEDYDLRNEILPSMITAVAPSVTLAANGTRHTLHSVHFHHYFSRTRQGRGVFDKRGVFASDPPIATCTPCGGGGATFLPPNTTTSTLSCTTETYHGVFNLPPTTTFVPCYNTNYTGPFQPSTSTSSGLPCCFTIPASCRINSTSLTNTSTTSFRASTGVFRSTTTTSSTTSRFSLTTPTSTTRSRSSSSSGSRGPILNSGTSSTSIRTTVTVISGTTTTISLTDSSSVSTSSIISSQPYTLASTSASTATTTYSIIVVSSTTITIFNPGTSSSTTGSGASSSLSTLTIITGAGSTTASTTLSVSVSTSIASNTIVGCGQASGSGIVEGSGTIYLAGTPIVTSGSASGYASSLSGCGTIIATTGTFSGNASVTGCGSGSGTGTITGSGTIWPWYGGGVLSYVTSGVITGQGNFSGCGTLTGSGTFVATTGSPILVTPSRTSTSSRPTKTVSVYLSYCPDSMATGMFRLDSGSNATQTQPMSPANLTDVSAILSSSLSSNSTTTTTTTTTSSSSSSSNNSTSNITTIINNPICQTCPESVGICCPPTVSCQSSDGKCPQSALENGGNTINGYLIQQVNNSSAPVAGRKKVRALAKKHSGGGGGSGGAGKDLVALDKKDDRHRHLHTTERGRKRAQHKHF